VSINKALFRYLMKKSKVCCRQLDLRSALVFNLIWTFLSNYNVFFFCRDESEQKPDTKMDTELQKAVKNIETKGDLKSELGEVKSEKPEVKAEGMAVTGIKQMFPDGIQRVTTNQQMALQVSCYCTVSFS
jgi:hypothetical protein